MQLVKTFIRNSFLFIKAVVKANPLSSVIFWADFGINILVRARKIAELLRIVKRGHFEHIIFGLDQGYGHTITGPCCAKQTYKGDILFVFFNQGSRLNEHHEILFASPRILFLRKCIRFSNDQTCIFLMNILRWLLYRTEYSGQFHYVADREFTVKHDVSYLYRDYCVFKSLPIQGPKVSSNDWVKFFIKDFDFYRNSIGFDNEKIISFKQLAHKIFGNRPIICIYRREKVSGGISSKRRVGGDLSNYADFLTQLHSHNFTIFAVGEIDKLKSSFDFIVSAENLNMEKAKFDLLAVLACDIFVGNVGGGSWLPLLGKSEKKIYIDAFPYWWKPNNSSVLYKRTFLNHEELTAETDRPLEFWESTELEVYDCDSEAIRQFVLGEVLK